MSDKMPRETRLHRRGNGRYYLKAWVPEDVRDLIPGGKSGQKWIALGTGDYKEATRLILFGTRRITDMLKNKIGKPWTIKESYKST